MLTTSAAIWTLSLLASTVVIAFYTRRFRVRMDSDRRRKEEAVKLGIDRPRAQYPFIDASKCIGCGACVAACPEGDPLGIVGGTAVVINGLRCVGHGSCETACPVGAIEVGMGDLKSRTDIPLLDEDLRTTVPGVYIAGELGGLSLVRNATKQGRQAVRAIAAKEPASGPGPALDLVIIGAGPAGLAAALEAQLLGLRYTVLEREAGLGGSLLHYPRRKMVLTQPLDLSPWGTLPNEEYSKEHLLETLETMVKEQGLNVRFEQTVSRVEQSASGLLVHTATQEFDTRNVLLSLGRRGTPRKLGVPGEELPKVMYRLIDAASYQDCRILVVGGGDSAVEAAVGLSRQSGNTVTLSYRKEQLFRIKRKNADAIEPLLAKGRIVQRFGTQPMEIGVDHVTLADPQGDSELLANDYVFIFAGGIPPFDFLHSVGIQFGGPDVASAAGKSQVAH